jgi:hypothetical protein
MKKNDYISLDTVVKQLEDLDVTDLNGEKVMMNLNKGQYFALNEVGSRIWDIIDKPICVKEIIEVLLKEYDIDKESCLEDVISFIGSMRDADIVKIN